jgi:hypothetical protein
MYPYQAPPVLAEAAEAELKPTVQMVFLALVVGVLVFLVKGLMALLVQEHLLLQLAAVAVQAGQTAQIQMQLV